MGRNIWDQIIEEGLLNDPNWAEVEAFAIRKVQQAWSATNNKEDEHIYREQETTLWAGASFTEVKVILEQFSYELIKE